MGGIGIFYGAGEQYSGGLSKGPSPSGFSSSTSYYGEADIGAEAAGGVTVQGNEEGLSGGIGGRLGAGVGAFIGAGKAKT